MGLLPALLLGLAVVLLVRGSRRPSARLPGPRPPRAVGTGPPAGAVPTRAACLLAALAVAVLLPPALGLPAAAATALAGPRALARLEPAAVRRDRLRLQADLPLVLDLLSACLAGGAPLGAAAVAVGRAVEGPAGRRRSRVAAALQVGTPPGTAWLLLAGDDPDRDPLGAAARSLSRSADSGAAVAAALSRLAEDARAGSRAAGAAAARRAGVLAVAPLGLCFLPAFVLLGVVPVVLGLAGPVLGVG